MRLCNDTITIFNARIDPETGGQAWTPTTISGVSWYATDAVSVDTSKGGLIAANKVIVRIPADADTSGKAYADPLAYADADDVTALWTLAEGDIIVKGVPGAGTWTPTLLKQSFADCMTILAVTDNRRAPNAPHWRVTGA